MRARPMIGGWEPPGIERIEAFEARRLAQLGVPGLDGDLQQDLGRGSLLVRLAGSMSGDEARDTFLGELRSRFRAGEPVDFVADITADAELEQVVIVHFDVSEHAGEADSFRYDLVLREYVEPPEPPGLGLDTPSLDDLALDIGLDVDLGLDLLDLPGLIGAVPEIGPLLEPVKAAADELAKALGGAAELFKPLSDVLES